MSAISIQMQNSVMWKMINNLAKLEYGLDHSPTVMVGENKKIKLSSDGYAMLSVHPKILQWGAGRKVK